MLQISSSKKPRWGKLDDIAYNVILPHQKLYMRNLKRKNSNKEKSTMYHMSQYHPPKNPYGENGWYDIILCQYCLIKNFLWETLKGKNSYKEKSEIWCFQQVINQRDERLSPLKLANLLYRYTKHIRNVEYGKFCEYLFEIITILSSPMFICPYDLWNRTILMQNIAISITCLSKQHKMHYVYR